MNTYSKYVDGLVKLIEEGKSGPLKEVIYARLKGETKPVHGLVSPRLSRDEADENAVFYFIYEKLEAGKNEPALMVLRRAVLELLMDAFARRDDLIFIDALGQMAGVFQVKEFPGLAEQLRQQLWGFMDTRLGKPPSDKPFTQMMQLERSAMEYAWRALDLWLTVTPPMPQDREAYYYEKIKKLYEEALDDFTPSELRFHLLVLIFRALIKIKPFYAGNCGFVKICQVVAELEKDDPSNKYRPAWSGLCNELGMIFKYDETKGKEWREEFKKGILAIDEKIDYGPVFWDSLKRMDHLDNEIMLILRRQPLEFENYSVGKFRPLRVVGQ